MAINRQGGATPAGLVFLRSNDEGQTWTFYKSIDTSLTNKFTADVIVVGQPRAFRGFATNDIALVYSYDYASNDPSSDDQLRKVYFQLWKYDEVNDWNLAQTRLLWDPGATGTMYDRAEIAVDSRGTYWVQAWRRASLAAGSYNDRTPEELVVKASNGVAPDVGSFEFGAEQVLATTTWRAGGRLVALPNPISGQPGRMMMLWNDYSGGTIPFSTKFRYRSDDAPLTTWSASVNAFPDNQFDGIYHGAAMSAVGDGAGNLHLIYKSQGDLRLRYRKYTFDTNTFGSRSDIDNGHDDWALQPATTMIGGDLYVFDNHLLQSELNPWPSSIDLNRYETRFWKLSTGWGPANFVSLGVENFFNGYPSAPEALPGTAPSVPYIYSQSPDGAAGTEMSIRVAPSNRCGPDFQIASGDSSKADQNGVVPLYVGMGEHYLTFFTSSSAAQPLSLSYSTMNIPSYWTLRLTANPVSASSSFFGLWVSCDDPTYAGMPQPQVTVTASNGCFTHSSTVKLSCYFASIGP